MESKQFKNIYRILCGIVIIIAALSFSGCIDGELDVSRLMEKPMEYTMPVGKHIEDRFWADDPDLMAQYTEYYIDIDPTYGEKLRISQVELLPQLIMEAYSDPDNIVEYDFKEKFQNKVTVYSDSNQKALELELASDGTIYARLDKDSPVFRFPEYVYYAMEGALWQIGDQENDITETCNSLIMPLESWSPSMGSTMLELRMDHDIKTMLYLMYGYADAVFVNYNIYSTLDLDRQYKIYMLLSYEGYEYVDEVEEVDGEEITTHTFRPRYGEVIPVQMVYSWVEGNFWALTDMKFAEYDEYGRLTETKIRNILPYLDTQQALSDLDDTSQFEEAVQRQAIEYLSVIGKGDEVERVERK